MNLSPTPAWTKAFPDSHTGWLVLTNVSNPAHAPELESQKSALEADLRQLYAGYTREQLAQLPTIQAYQRYYKAFDKNYHVLFQLESVALKGKNLPGVAALVEAMFMAELQNQLLTAGHDLDTLQTPLRLDVSDGTETYTLLNGKTQQFKAGDMFIADAAGIISSILYGPDQRTCITPQTRQAAFAVYAPAGIHPVQLRQHMEQITANVRLFAHQTEVLNLQVLGQ
jgi:DNA/RNA-binding domain of Phe-tRNA-synthetase-like protein